MFYVCVSGDNLKSTLLHLTSYNYVCILFLKKCSNRKGRGGSCTIMKHVIKDPYY